MTTRRRKKHRPEEVVAKLRDADAMLNAGKDLAAVLQAHADRDVFQASPDELPAIDIHSL